MGPLEILLGLAIVGYFIYRYFFSFQNFWKDRGVNGPKPHPLYGNLRDQMFLRQSIGQSTKKLYEEFPKEPMIGIFARSTPILMLKDPELIKDVIIKNFSNFVHRGLKIHDKVEPLSQHLFLLEPKRWRPLRIRLSPVFTSGKLKDMFYIIKECCDYFEELLEKVTEKGEPVEVRDLFAKFTTDIIGSCAFGLNMKSLVDEDSEFRKMGKKVFSTNITKLIKFRIREIAPWLYNFLGKWMMDKELVDFFTNSIKDTIEYRERENIRRHDFVDLLMDIKNNPEKLGDIEMTDSLLAAQAFVFFLAGFETSSTTLANIAYELALNPSIQEKVREEVMEEVQKADGDLTYDSIKNMKYMHQVFNETLRLYPPVTVLMRESAEPYTFTGTKVTIPAKQRIWIPIYAIQLDPEIYPDPLVFDPERFSEENMKARHPMFHLPFGDGPRNCIGERFAIYQVKTGLARILQHYRLEVCDKTEIPYIVNSTSFLHSPKNGIYLKFNKVDAKNGKC